MGGFPIVNSIRTSPELRTGILFIPKQTDGLLCTIFTFEGGSIFVRSVSMQFPPEQPVSNKVSIPVCATKTSAEHRTSGRCLPEFSTPAAPPWTGPLANENPGSSMRKCQSVDRHILLGLLHNPDILPTRHCTHRLTAVCLSSDGLCGPVLLQLLAVFAAVAAVVAVVVGAVTARIAVVAARVAAVAARVAAVAARVAAAAAQVAAVTAQVAAV